MKKRISISHCFRGQKLTIDPQTRASVLDILKPIVGRAPLDPEKKGQNAYIDAFLQKDGRQSPSYEPLPLASPPLFPRDRTPGGALAPTGRAPRAISGFKELGELIQKEARIESDGSDDMYKEHLMVVNGWGVCMRFKP